VHRNETAKKKDNRLLEDGRIADENERQRLEFLLKTKKWNPERFT